jgi:NADPH:quinone reductase-like Zn-dependent oxidoreductase
MRSGIAGVVESVPDGVAGFAPGDEVFGVTTPRLIRPGAPFAIVAAARLARKPCRIDFALAAAIPAVAVTAWQMLFALGRVGHWDTVMILGAASPVGVFTLQLARAYGVRCIAQAAHRHAGALRALGADRVIDAGPGALETACARTAVIVDTAGGMLQRRAFGALRPGATLVSCVSRPDRSMARHTGIGCEFCVTDVTTLRLQQIAGLIDLGLVTPTLDMLFGLAPPEHPARAPARVSASDEAVRVAL